MDKKEKILNGYYKWLCSLVNPTLYNDEYSILIKTLYDTDFYWTVRNDNNRVFEGKNLREKFCEVSEIEYEIDWFREESSMLELLIGLAYRCENIMQDTEHYKDMHEWFWIMLNNVELDRFTDNQYYNFGLSEEMYPENIKIVDDILRRIIDRKYTKSGKGGLFPLMSAKKNQREVELWYQMNSYLVENYHEEYFEL